VKTSCDHRISLQGLKARPRIHDEVGIPNFRFDGTVSVERDTRSEVE
jgi:hypothetical protein